MQKNPFERQDWKTGEAEKGEPAVAVQKYTCLYDKAIPVFHNKNTSQKQVDQKLYLRRHANKTEKNSLLKSFNSCDYR